MTIAYVVCDGPNLVLMDEGDFACIDPVAGFSTIEGRAVWMTHSIVRANRMAAGWPRGQMVVLMLFIPEPADTIQSPAVGRGEKSVKQTRAPRAASPDLFAMLTSLNADEQTGAL